MPAGRDAVFTWKGVLESADGGDWELRIAGNPSVTLDGKSSAAGTLVHLDKNKPVAIEIVAREQANPPAQAGGRGGHGGRGGGGFGGRGFGGFAMPQARVALVTPALPDLSSLQSADAVIVCIGLNRNVEAEGRDRPFDLPAAQQYLVKKAAAMNPRTIVITNAGAAIGMQSWINSPAAIVHAYYLGEEGGIAVGKMLFGDIDPSGRLCSTFDKAWEENPAYPYYPGAAQPGADYPVEPYTEGLFYGYRGYDKAAKEPQFPFGFGLSYTTFDLSNMKAQSAGQGVNVSLDVKNTGSRTGDEVVQIYVGETACPEPRPLRELKGFSKVALAPGETRRVQITLPRDAFAYWSGAKKRGPSMRATRLPLRRACRSATSRPAKRVQVQ